MEKNELCWLCYAGKTEHELPHRIMAPMPNWTAADKQAMISGLKRREWEGLEVWR